MQRFIALAAALLVAGPVAAQDARKPNIIFILADDLGWTDLGCQGSKYYETPNIDRLAADGLTFTSAYTAGPNCQPTRAALMTGRYGARTGVFTVGTSARGDARFRKLIPTQNTTDLPLDEVTLGQVMKSAGYRTGHFGKWHLGQKGPYHPSQRGFDEAIVSMGKHFNFATQPAVKVPEGTYLADFLTDQAVRFIEKNKDQPFYLELHHFAVHTPLEAKKELIARFEKKQGVNGHANPVYAAMLASVDESVGRVLAKLDELKLAENTMVIFTSDNGGVRGYNAAGVPGARDITNNAPLRGGKGMFYEGGVRVAFLVRWTGRIRRGSRSDVPIISVDLLPTFAELAGAKLDPQRPLDGASLADLWKTSGQASFQRDALYWHFPCYLEGGKGSAWRTTPVSSIRSGDYKLLHFLENDRVELYNLAKDLSQKTDLAQAEPERTRELRDNLERWRRALNVPGLRPNPEYAAGKK